MGLRSARLTLAMLSLMVWSGCSTTTHGVVGSQATADWIKRNQSRPCSVTFKKRLQAQPIKGGLWMPTPTASPSLSPETRIRLVSGGEEQEISLETVRTMEVVNSPRGVPDGALIGAGIGALAGAVLGYSGARNYGTEGEPSVSGKLELAGIMATIVSLVGAMVGAGIGADVGHRDILTF